jgi:hypothetical protein
MSSPYDATIVNLSSGQIHFADPTKPWGPADFPNLPSTLLAITARGSIEDGNVSTITFTNAITYEPYESAVLQASLLKTLQIQQNGVIVYSEPRVGLLSTFSPAFSQPVTAFETSSIGGASIFDVTSLSPDTITNAIGKLDAWIANAFLYQPPSVTYANSETNAFYGGVQWLNPNVYNVLDKSVPYVNSILFIIGDPATPNYLSFEINDCTYFPYKTYRDGISPAQYPVVRLRIFTDFFLSSADALYSKQVMQTKCIRILSESGNAIFPTSGKVFAVEHTNGIDSYTTVSIYLPNLPASYAKDSDIPVRIVYLNKTDGVVNVAQFSTTQASFGGPGPLSSIVGINASVTAVTSQYVKPELSDAVHNISTPFISSYATEYTYKQMQPAHNDGYGFRYGMSTPTDTITLVSSIQNVPFTKSSPYIASTQNVSLTGLIPGAQYSTSVTATNLSKLSGTETAGPFLSTLYPAFTTPRIDSISIVQTTPNSHQADASTLTYPTYVAGGWATGANVSSNVLFVSSGTTLSFQLSSATQWNDVSFPGDRSSFTVQTVYIDINAVPNTTVQLVANTIQEDYPLNSSLQATSGLTSLETTLYDPQSDPAQQKFYYNANIQGSQFISTISSQNQYLQVSLTNRAIVGGPSGVAQLQTYSTPLLVFQTEPANVFATQNMQIANQITDIRAVSGIYTPSRSSIAYVNVDTQNIGNLYFGNHKIAETQLNKDGVPLETVVFSSGVIIRDGASPVTSTPFPQNTWLTVSSIYASFGSSAYQDPFDPSVYSIGTTLYPGNTTTEPLSITSTLQSTIFIDTVSNTDLFVSSGMSTGQRIVSMLPRLEVPGTVNNMNDGVNPITNIVGAGLNVSLSSFISAVAPSTINYSTLINYNHMSSISSIYTDVYSRELLYTNGLYVHPRGYDFTQFNGAVIGNPLAVYPDFSLDLAADNNFGYRYATFVYETPVFSTPTLFQYINVCVNNPSLVSSIYAGGTNNWFPNAPVINMYDSKVKLHSKLFATYVDNNDRSVETGWVNVMKSLDEYTFTDATFDVGGCVLVSTIGSSVIYKSQINRRAFTKIGAAVRIGVAADTISYCDSQITFSGLNVYFSDT